METVKLYHGTGNDFEKFDANHLGKNFSQHANGFWFTTSKRNALPFAMNSWASKVDYDYQINNEVFLEPFLQVKKERIKQELIKVYRFGINPVYPHYPLRPGDHWHGAKILTCHVNDDLLQVDEFVNAPGIVGSGDSGLFNDAIATAQSGGYVGIHFSQMREGVGAGLSMISTVIVLDADSISIQSSMPIMDAYNRFELLDMKSQSDLFFNDQVPEYDFIADAITHLPHESGEPYQQDTIGKWLVCGEEQDELNLVVTDSMPTCPDCRQIFIDSMEVA